MNKITILNREEADREDACFDFAKYLIANAMQMFNTKDAKPGDFIKRFAKRDELKDLKTKHFVYPR